MKWKGKTTGKSKIESDERTCNLSVAVNMITPSSFPGQVSFSCRFEPASVVVLVLNEIHCHSGDQMVSCDVAGNNDSSRIWPHPVRGHSSSYAEVREVGPVWPNHRARRVCVYSAAVFPVEVQLVLCCRRDVRSSHVQKKPTVTL